jgi:uncharacterized repeat protein (TIGR03803 family)
MKRLFLIAALAAVSVSTLAQGTLTLIHTFDGIDGMAPISRPAFYGGTVYGTTQHGGSNNYGTVFAVSTNGLDFRTLYSFTGGSDGGEPVGDLVLISNVLYGVADTGGYGSGTVFSLNTDGSGFRVLHSFSWLGPYALSNSDGAYPSGALVLSGNTLYGTAFKLGVLSNGTVFAVNTDGSGFRVVHSLNGAADGTGPAGLIISGNILYGTTFYGSGGSSLNGTVFAVNTDGTGFTTLYTFNGASDGREAGGLLSSSNILYGTTFYDSSGTVQGGAVFALNTDGSGFKTLHNFTSGSDGGGPNLVLSGNTLYGTTFLGGGWNKGTVFTLHTDGTDFMSIYSFNGGIDGGFPNYLVLSGNTLYGIARGGGISDGTIFSLSVPVILPQLTITPLGGNVILTWPTNFSSFTLQSTTNLTSPVWTTNVPAPVVVNRQYTVTNPISGTQQFFRLSQ